MTRSSRDPDAYDRIRDDKLTGTNWPDAVPAIPCDICGEPSPVDTDKAAIFHACNQAGVRRRIAELEAQLAAVRLLIVAIDECLICNPNPAERIVELICDPFRNPFAAQMQSRKRGTAAAQQEGEQ